MAITINRKGLAISAVIGLLASMVNAEQSANGEYNSQRNNGQHNGQIKNGANGNVLDTNGNIVEVAEPTMLALLGVGIAALGLGALLRRRDK